MGQYNRVLKGVGIAIVLFGILACQPEVGSEKWCKELKSKLDEGLTLEGSKQYAQHCLFK